MHPCPAERSRVAVRLLQVWKGLFVQLHGISGKPAFHLLTPQMKPAAQAHRENRINGTDYQADCLPRYGMMAANLQHATFMAPPPPQNTFYSTFVGSTCCLLIFYSNLFRIEQKIPLMSHNGEITFPNSVILYTKVYKITELVAELK